MCVAEVRTCVFIVFVSSIKWVYLQCQECSSSVPEEIVSSTKSVHLQHKTFSPIVINLFVCSAISYSEVSSRGYLDASDKSICLYCDTVFGREMGCTWKLVQKTPKQTKNWGGRGKFLKKTSFQVGMDLIKYRNNREWGNLKYPIPLRNNDGPPPCPSTECTCIPSSLCCIK